MEVNAGAIQQKMVRFHSPLEKETRVDSNTFIASSRKRKHMAQTLHASSNRSEGEINTTEDRIGTYHMSFWTLNFDQAWMLMNRDKDLIGK